MGVERAGAGDKVAPERVPLDAGVVSKGRSGEVIGAPARAPEVAIGEITLLKAVPGACGTREPTQVQVQVQVQVLLAGHLSGYLPSKKFGPK